MNLKLKRIPKALCAVFSAMLMCGVLGARERWTCAQANGWYEKVPFLAGVNYVPSNAINQIEMWSDETFDAETIDRELGYAQGVGFNTVRVFLSDIVWMHDSGKFYKNFERFLEIAERRGFCVMPTFFTNGGKYTHSEYGKQPEPKAGIHNSGWVKAPRFEILMDESKWDAHLKNYMVSFISRYAQDRRIIAWDVYNEPGNLRWVDGSPESEEMQKAFDMAQKLLPKAFEWAREANPSQPLTACVFMSDKHRIGRAFNHVALAESDIISYHSYGTLLENIKLVAKFRELDRPIFCTEYMARHLGNTFAPMLGFFKANKIAAYSWGICIGKTQTEIPWGSLTVDESVKGVKELWFHDIFYRDGTPFEKTETDYIRRVMSEK